MTGKTNLDKGVTVGYRTTYLLLALSLITLPVLAETLSADEIPQIVELRQSARGGDTDAKYQLGEIYEKGLNGARRSLSEAANWYSAAAAAGHTDAQRTLALMHLDGRGVPQSFEESQKLFFQAAQKNDEVSQYNLGVLLLTGRGGQMSVETAVKWLEKAAQTGHQGAQLELGTLYIKGVHVTSSM